jgi:3-dehydroquinate synthetase
MAEVIKHGVIGSPGLFSSLERAAPTDFGELVASAVRVKVDVVERDPLEQGERALLNLGHTFGHAFELMSDFSLKHGVAVGVGLVAAASMAAMLGECEPGLVQRVEKALHTQNLPSRLSSYSAEQVVDAMKHDKKRVKKRIRFIIPKGIGECRILEEAPDDVIRRAVSRVLVD